MPSQESTSFFIDRGVEETSSATARNITSNPVLQEELAQTVKLGVYAGLCAGSVKVGKKLVDSLAKSTIERSIYKGGNYDGLKIIDRPHNIERHHIPAASISTTSRGRGMAIQMEADDHAKTSSFRNSLASRRYREMIRQKIEQGDIRDAVATEIADVKRATGRKYNGALIEMLNYGKREGIIPEKK